MTTKLNLAGAILNLVAEIDDGARIDPNARLTYVRKRLLAIVAAHERAEDDATTAKPVRTCLACHARPSCMVDEPEVPALCSRCHSRRGDDITVGGRVIDSVCESQSGIVQRLEDDGQIAIVCTADGDQVWTPVALLIRVFA